MDNSKIVFDELSLPVSEQADVLVQLREKESKLIKLIQAIETIKDTDEWSTLKTFIFADRVNSLEGRLAHESLNIKLDDSEIYRLQGRLFEARKYDLDSLAESYRLELSQIKKLLPKEVS